MERMFKMNNLLLMVLLLCITIFFGEKTARSGGIIGEGLGAKAMSMGGAFIGLADDSSAIYWNPSGLARDRKSVV